MPQMTSKERVQAVMRHEDVDHLPLTIEGLCHGWAKFVNDRYPDPFKRMHFFQELGLDCGVMFEYPFEAFPDTVQIREWESGTASSQVLLHKTYTTPAGMLQQVVRYTEDYQPLLCTDPMPTPEQHEERQNEETFNTRIPLLCDHNVPPTRSVHYLIEEAEHLDTLDLLLNPLIPRIVDRFYASLKEARKYCTEHGMVLSLYAWGIGDPLMWMSGVERILAMALEEKEVLHRYIDIIARWQQQILEIAIAGGVDHIVRRGWYESTDFWSPALYREFLLEPLRQEVAIAHQADVTVDYVMASGSMPLLELMPMAGIDMYSNIDPMAPNTDLQAIRAKIGDAVALCGGVNNYHILEQGDEDAVRQAVLAAIEVFTPPTGCILAPSDVLLLGDPAIIERNFYIMVDTWREASRS